ncbi:MULTISPECIES: UvrD-helicase domain-containing protein [unclassified Bradyrhizobium]|uniref:UvrD-helicase domain-containing protein n=1 Tax=unclassified Bradyrhizobium TaxID=2631580 RepID=UPI0029169D42|nr:MULTISPECIES: UvrD-helicase domain-containing protein [unclassified Bradyrhizobium]
MTKLPDEAERLRALMELASTLLVEAAAGTGKTSLLAGRVLCLLASGVAPREIAAITFTEFAAGELRERIARYLQEILSGRVPEELRLAFPSGPTPEQSQALQEVAKRFDELTCTTIHGFCHVLLRIYAVEAGIDPGAEIIDRAQADLAFATIFERWLRDRLSGMRAASDPIAQTAERDPIHAEELLRELAEFRRAHRTARPLPARIETDADVAFSEAVAEFRRWFNSIGAPAEAEQDLVDLEQLARHFRGKFAPVPDFEGLWKLAHPARVAIMRKSGLDLLDYRRLGVWRGAAGKVEGERLAAMASEHYEACAAAFREIMGQLATAIVSVFSAELDELIQRFESFKRSAAVLDFDDLLHLTREVFRSQTTVRAAAKRFTRVLVDEFQDTDPIQAEIIFLLTSVDAPAPRWHERRLVPGRLFMVGDPKQAIYRFRGADIATYRLARAAIERQFPGNLVPVAANFRSCDGILRHINQCFQTPLQGQESGYVALEPTRKGAEHGLPGVVKVKVEVIPQSRVDDIRDEEAKIVAETCARLIGNLKIRRANRGVHLLSPGDIALLAPTGRELWHYERALEEAELPFSSQAGKNFYRRQEVQDLVALVRALGDSRDTIALGALMRGPLVGLTEEELLDLSEALASKADGDGSPPRLNLLTDPDIVPHPVARETLTILRDLQRRVRSTAPALLLGEAVERLRVRAILMTRSPDQASRALANVDALLEKARAYGVRGFRQFVRDVDEEWSRRFAHDEGVIDADEHSIKIVTIHSSKGLEWPVVIPINTASGARPPEQFVHRRSDDTLHWMLGDVVPPALADAMTSQAQEEAEERLRLLYVACTRAMDLLVLPALSWSANASWARTVDLQLDQVADLNIANLARKSFARPVETANTQTRPQFETEQADVERAFARIRWIRPSDADPDLVTFDRPAATAWDQPAEPISVQGAGSARGIVLHKIMEELVTGEVEANVSAIRERSTLLVQQLYGPAAPESALDAHELAETALRTWSLPELASNRAGLIAEVPVYGRLAGDGERLVAGRADAVRYVAGRPQIVFDWKSDVDPDAASRADYANQLGQYVHVLGAERGAVVYMTAGRIEWVEKPR